MQVPGRRFMSVEDDGYSAGMFMGRS